MKTTFNVEKEEFVYLLLPAVALIYDSYRKEVALAVGFLNFAFELTFKF